jgi:hypothetical protein
LWKWTLPVAADVALWDALEAVKAKPARRVGKARKDAPSERVVQRQIVRALRALGIITAHAPNGSHLAGDKLARMKQSAALVADGVLVGLPDLLCISRDGALGFIEVKREGGRVSSEQERVIALMNTRSVPVAVVCTLDDALAAVKSWGWL